MSFRGHNVFLPRPMEHFGQKMHSLDVLWCFVWKKMTPTAQWSHRVGTPATLSQSHKIHFFAPTEASKKEAFMSGARDSPTKKLIDYTKQGKEMEQECATRRLALHESCTENNTRGSSTTAKEESIASRDRLQSTLDLLKRASESSTNQDVSTEQVDFMLKIPLGFNRRQPSDLRERFPATPAMRRTRSTKKRNRIETALADTSHIRTKTRRSWHSS